MRASIAAALLALALATAADAQTANRAWVSGKGTDAPGCGAPTNACRSFQYAHDHIVAAGGEIDALDGAGYGAVTITKALSIVGIGAVAAVQQPNSGADAITVSAGASDAVHLRGLTIDGLGIAHDGIRLLSGGALDIVGCVARHFIQDGIAIELTSAATEVSITDTLASDNFNGVRVNQTAPVRVAVRGSAAYNNTYGGFDFFGASLIASVVDSQASGDNVGFDAGNIGGTSYVSLRKVTSTNNGIGVGVGQDVSGGATVLTVGRSLISGNTSLGAAIFVGQGSATIFSFGDNRFNGNANDGSGFLTPITMK